MKIINLKDYYDNYKTDCFICVPDEIAETLDAYERKEKNYQRKLRYNKVFSLDKNDGVENTMLMRMPSLEKTYILKQLTEMIFTELYKLPQKQFRRIYAHYMLGLTMVQIAKIEGVSKQTVRISIQRGIKKINKKMKNF